MISISAWALVVVVTVSTIFAVRLSQCLPAYRRRRRDRHRPHTQSSTTLSTMVVFGSGGHTAEMLKMIRALSTKQYGPFYFILAQTDGTSKGSIDAARLPFAVTASIFTIFRSREVHQGWVLTFFTTLYSLFQSFLLVARLRPDVLLVNGPGKNSSSIYPPTRNN